MFYVSYIFYKFLRISYVYYQTKSYCVEKLVVYNVTTSFFVCKQRISKKPLLCAHVHKCNCAYVYIMFFPFHSIK
ncbi:hypothetical protein CT694_34530 (plasmid) [Bacillus wiedmannii bv. thuringiensis]|nr:hypothetical protein CT694_34530 [Bacillus wiedmannii bv. thuringiensis]